MPDLNISVPYQIPQDEALRRIQRYIAQLKTQYAGTVSDLQESWNGPVGTLSGSASGLSVSGTISVNPSMVVVDIALPFAAAFFKSRIETALRDQLTRILA